MQRQTAKACNRDEQVRHYLGDNNKKLDLESNWKLRPILDLLRKNPSIGVNEGKPIVLWWMGDGDNDSKDIGDANSGGDNINKNTSLLQENAEVSDRQQCPINVAEEIPRSEVSEVSEAGKAVYTEENSPDYGKGMIEENKLLAVKSQISHNANEGEQEGNSSSRRTPIERKTRGCS